MSHCKPCEVCPITELCIQSVRKDIPCPLDKYEDNTNTTITITKEKE